MAIMMSSLRVTRGAAGIPADRRQCWSLQFAFRRR
jgi:hypothetical protein